jgi:hypothetical protein
VPRHAATTDGSTAGLRDARLIIARELGFPTWRELVSFTEKSRRDVDERGETWRRLRPQAEALLAGDTDRLARLTAEQADTLLQMLAYREAIPPVSARRGARCAARRGGCPDRQGHRPGPPAYPGRLLQPGGVRAAAARRRRRPRHPDAGHPPLENAIYSDSTQVVDLLAEHGIVPQALWTYAACGRLDLVEACFDADARLRPDAASSRPTSGGPACTGRSRTVISR